MSLATAALVVLQVAVRSTGLGATVAFAIGLTVTALLAAVVASQRPEHPSGWLLGGIALSVAASSAVSDYVQTSVASEAMWPGTVELGWLSTWVAVPAVPLAALLLLTFPTGRLTSRRGRVAAVVIVIAGVLQIIAVALFPGPLPTAPSLKNPLGLDGAEPVLESLSGISGVAAAVVLVAAVGRLLLRYRQSEGVERSQLRTLALSLPIAVLGGTAALLVEGGPLNEASFYFAAFGVTAIPVALGWAVLRHGLFDITVLINRALVYGSLTLTVGGLYVLVVIGLGRALRASVELGLSVVATAVVAVAFGPVRDRLQGMVDRFMYGNRVDPYTALSRLGRQLEQATTADTVLPTTAAELTSSLKLESVQIDEFRDGDHVPVATSGAPSDTDPLRFDLVHGGMLVGRVSVWPRTDETLSARDLDLLQDVCRSVSVAVHAARIDRDLRLSRQVLVTARAEERRRLRADLHDGLGPELAGVVLGLGAVRKTVRSDVDAAEALITGLQRQLREAVGQVRSLVEGLAPAVDQLGLEPAIRQDAERLTSMAGIDLEITIAIEGPLPAATEVAAYRIVMEALTNAVRHGRPARSWISVLQQPSEIIVAVDDDGVGLPSTIVPGVGLSSMRQRAVELGGTCEVGPAPTGGTRVEARLPL